jgi:hypothetical protein
MRDLETFIDLNVNGIKKRKIKIKRLKEDKEKLEKFFAIENLNFFSENSQFERLLGNNKITEKVNDTLSKISKILFKYKFR